MAIGRVKGEEEVLKNLNRFILATKGRTQQGILRALKFIEPIAVEKTPVDTGALQNSFYTRLLVFRGKFPAGEIGNTSEYAIFVHEDLEARHLNGEAKFLSNAILSNTRTILDIIASHIRV